MLQVSEIKEINTSKFTVALFANFHLRINTVLDEVVEDHLVKLHIPKERRTRYKELVALLLEKNRETLAYTETSTLRSGDSERDRVLSLIFYMVSNGLKSNDPGVRAAAEELNRILSPFKNIQWEPDASETSLVDGLLNKMSNENLTEPIELLGLTDPLERLREANDQVRLAQAQRSNRIEQESKAMTTSEIRKALAEEYGEECALIYASGLLTEEPDDVSFIQGIIDEINAIVEDCKTTYNRSQGQKSGNKKDDKEPTEPENPDKEEEKPAEPTEPTEPEEPQEPETPETPDGEGDDDNEEEGGGTHFEPVG